MIMKTWNSKGYKEPESKMKPKNQICKNCGQDLTPKKCLDCGNDGAIKHISYVDKEEKKICHPVTKFNHCEKCRSRKARSARSKKFEPQHSKDCKGCPDCPATYICNKCEDIFPSLNTSHDCKPKNQICKCGLIEHIRTHLKKGEDVVCKICGITHEETCKKFACLSASAEEPQGCGKEIEIGKNIYECGYKGKLCKDCKPKIQGCGKFYRIGGDKSFKIENECNDLHLCSDCKFINQNCGYFKATGEICPNCKPKNQGCGKELTVKFEGHNEKVESYCGIMGILCPDCKPKNHSPQNKIYGEKSARIAPVNKTSNKPAGTSKNHSPDRGAHQAVKQKGGIPSSSEGTLNHSPPLNSDSVDGGTLSDKIKPDMIISGGIIPTTDIKDFIRRRLERTKMIIKMYPHKHGEELAGQLNEDLMNDAGSELI